MLAWVAPKKRRQRIKMLLPGKPALRKRMLNPSLIWESSCWNKVARVKRSSIFSRRCDCTPGL